MYASVAQRTVAMYDGRMAAKCQVRVPARQVRLQRVTEALSPLVAVPVLAFAAWKATELPMWSRWALGGLAVAHLAVDGGFLMTWRK